MRRWSFFLLLLLFNHSVEILAESKSHVVETEHPEVERVKGFSEYLQQKRKSSSDQERGLQIHLESLEIQAREYEKARKEYASQKKLEKSPEESISYRDHIIERQASRRGDLAAAMEFKNEKARERQLLRGVGLNSMTELGLPEKRPRFELEKRSLYGGKANYSKPSESLPDRNFGRPSNQFTAPPPMDPEDSFGAGAAPFDEFPPPAFPDEGFDLPPPPPMEPGTEDFFPPPPPPPEFDDGMNF